MIDRKATHALATMSGKPRERISVGKADVKPTARAFIKTSITIRVTDWRKGKRNDGRLEL